MSQRDHVEDPERRKTRVQSEQRNCSYRLVCDYVDVVKPMLGKEIHLPLRVMDRMEAPQEIVSMPRDMTRGANAIPGEDRDRPCDNRRQHSVRNQFELPEHSPLHPD